MANNIYSTGGSLKKFELTGLTYITGATNTGYAILEYGNYIYVGSTNIKRYNKSDLSYVDQSPATGLDMIRILISDGTYIYIGGTNNTAIKKYNLSDLSYVATTTDTPSTTWAFFIDDNYLYAGRGYYLSKFTLSGLTSVATIHWGGVDDATPQGIRVIGDYVYVGGFGTHYVRKFNKSDLTDTGQYINNGGNTTTGSAIGLIDDGVYLYVPVYTNSVRKYLISDLSYLTQSPSYGVYTAYDIAQDNYYIYLAGALKIIKRYRKDNMTYVDASLTQSDYIYRLSVDGNGLPPPPVPLFIPTGVTGTSITCTGATLSWHNNNVSGQTGNYIQKLSGVTWITIATISSGTTSYILTGLTPNLLQYFRVVAYNSTTSAASASYGIQTQDPAPFNIGIIVNDLLADVTWDINDPPYGTAIRPELRVSGQTAWNTLPLLAKNAVAYTYTGLSWSTNYQGRIVRIGTEYPSIIFGFTTPTFKAPSGLTVTSIGDKQICLSWQNNSMNDDIGIWVRQSGYTWYEYANVINGTTSICVTGLSMGTLYTFAVLNNYGIYSLSSNQVQATTTVTFIPPFCLNQSYSVTGTTCGNSTGIIAIPDDATIFYNFTLEDIQGNFYTLSDFSWTGLSASWYQITATVKPQWYYHYGQESCILDWIPLEDTDTTLTLTATKIKNAVCQGFGSAKGRIIFQFTDSNTGATSWTFSLYNEAHVLVNTQNLTGITNIQYNSPPDIYYGILENNLGCTYLIDLTQVLAEKIWTVEGITDVYITPWTAGVSYNYYSNSDDDWYVGSIDSLQFTSTKIKEFNGLTDFWYKINLVTAVASYSENLNKGSSGLVYNETFTLTIPHADNQKWKELVNILTNRYIIVFKDANGLYWVLGYRSGTEVRNYQLADNQYAISFNSPAVSKMLTNLDEAYVKLQIL